MAMLSQLETICFSSLQKQQARDFLSFISSDYYQSIIPCRASPRYLSSSSSTTLRIFCAGSNAQSESKSRSRRNARSNTRDVQFCKELQLFLSSHGLPVDKVPSTKELSNHGREDLAKIVRRRGYKAAQALLAEFIAKPGDLQEDQGVRSAKDDDTRISIAEPDSRVEQVERIPNFDDAAQSLSSTATTVEENEINKALESATATFNGSITSNQGEEDLHRRAAEFVRTGRLDPLQDSDEDEEEDDDEFFEDSSDEDEVLDVQNKQNDIEAIAAEKAAKLWTMTSRESSRPVAETILGSLGKLQLLKESSQVTSEKHPDFGSQVDLEVQEIKSALIKKEEELREVSRDLEETKAQLALIQAKATAEVAQAKQLALEKDIRLKSADLALANLKRVQVEYWGEGERVELAGSFNGWKYFAVMKPDPTSEISKPNGLRGPMMWGTELWLYPGVYEIKFIIDGVWQIDQRREIVTRNSHDNNILRVEP